MAKTLQELLAPDAVAEAIRKVKAPVHKIENVGGDPHRLRTVCGCISWYSPRSVRLIDPNRPALDTVTCPKCLEYLASLADTPIIVEAAQ